MYIAMKVCEKWVQYDNAVIESDIGKKEKELERTNKFNNLVKCMEENFPELEESILGNLGEQDETYLSICKRLQSMITAYPFIAKIKEGTEGINISAEEHQILLEFFKADLEKEEIERKKLYFQGHIDGYAYMRKVGAIVHEKD